MKVSTACPCEGASQERTRVSQSRMPLRARLQAHIHCCLVCGDDDRGAALRVARSHPDAATNEDMTSGPVAKCKSARGSKRQASILEFAAKTKRQRPPFEVEVSPCVEALIATSSM